MKTLIFSLVLMLFAGIANAQEITELKEAKVEAQPLSSEITRSGDNFTFRVKETSVGEFQKNPLLFVQTHFDVEELKSAVGGEREIYFVTFKSSRGNLQADFNNKGEIVKSTSKFKDIALPRELMHDLYRDHKGWEMVKNIHITRGKNGVVHQDIYKIKLENGKTRKNIVLEGPAQVVSLAGN